MKIAFMKNIHSPTQDGQQHQSGSNHPLTETTIIVSNCSPQNVIPL